MDSIKTKLKELFMTFDTINFMLRCEMNIT